jgi:hypothetical protein
MENYIRSSMLPIILFGISGILSAQIIYQSPEKKLVEFGWASPTTLQYINNIDLYESGPFDGISVKLSKDVGGGNIFMIDNWKQITEQAKLNELEMVKTIGEKATLEDNFLVLYGASQMDWFSDQHWKEAESYIRYAANLARIGNFKGIIWDPEPYKPGKNPWKMSDQPNKDNRSYYEYYLQVRKRGAQFIKAIQDEFPGLVLFSLREFSDYQTASPFSQAILPLRDMKQSKSDLEEAWWALHLPFSLGVLDAINEDVTFIDGNEEAYYYTSAIEFFKVRNEIFNDTRALIPPGLHQKFKANYYLGHAVSTDYIAGNWAGLLNGFPYRLSGQGAVIKPEERAKWFEHNIYYALQTSDEYVWLYTEDASWWTGENIPAGFPEALKRAREKVLQVEPLGFEVEEMLKDARDIAERKDREN